MPPKSEVESGFGKWEEWRYRHEFFWAATTRWLVAVLAVAAIPYTSEPVRKSFGLLTLAFPVSACLLGAIAFGHLLAEHARALYVRWHAGYREKESEFLSERDPIGKSLAHSLLRKPIRWRIGPYIFSALGASLLGLTGLNLLVSQPYLERELLGELPKAWSIPLNILGFAWLGIGIILFVGFIVADLIRPKR